MMIRNVCLSVLALVICVSAFGQGGSNITLLYQWNDMSLPSSSAHNNRYNEVWGIAQGGREYAVIDSTMGTHIFDISDPLNPTTAGYYDTSTEPHVAGNYRGNWGVYPFLPSGLILASDMQNGLFVLDPSQAVGIIPDEDATGQMLEMYPNPFDETLAISINEEKLGKVHINIYNELGALIVSFYETADGDMLIDTSNLQVGIYEVSVIGKTFSETHKLIKIK